jgi:colanic acid/amylovoran biosynthesis protein
MGDERPLFILAGNGPYENRGCEAIVRGTTKILREYFRNPHFICLSNFRSEKQFKEQCLRETDGAIVHLASHQLSKKQVFHSFWKLNSINGIFHYLFNQDAFLSWVYQDMLPYLDDTIAVLSIGGDNYSLDYGIPTRFIGLDNIVLERGRSQIIWGASVGPFSAIPDYERYMSNHLQKITAIFARESATVEYLESIGVSRNVYAVADPAFLMDSAQPKEEMSIEEGAIGLNLSPLMAKFITGSDVEQWTDLAAEIMTDVARTTERQIYLIPHVTNPGSNDYTFMQRALSKIRGKNEKITLIPPRYTAAETKWIISQMALFAGTRTHATIAALSSGVPTLSFTYSIKGKGINQDIFGHTAYCMTPKDLDAGEVSSRITSIFDDSTAIRRELTERIPLVKRAAMNAGMELKQLIEEN